MQGRPKQKRYFYIIAFFSTKYNQKNTGILCRTFVRFYQKSGCKMPVFHRETKRDLFYLDGLLNLPTFQSAGVNAAQVSSPFSP